MAGMEADDNLILFPRPVSVLDGWVQVVVPALPALLPQPTLKVACHQGPLLGTVMVDQPQNELVFLWLGIEGGQAPMREKEETIRGKHVSRNPADTHKESPSEDEIVQEDAGTLHCMHISCPGCEDSMGIRPPSHHWPTC